MKNRLISLMLCVAMLFTLTACNGGAEETTPPTTTVPPTTTEPGPDAAAIYSDAAAQMELLDSMLVYFTLEKEMTVGSDTYAESQLVTLSMLMGEENFAAWSSTDYTWGAEYDTTASDIFSEGTYYGTVGNYHYSLPMTAEEYQARFAPAALLDPSLYSNVELTGETSIAFSDASAIESWLSEDGMELVEASGTAKISQDGILTDCSYDVTYIQSGVTTHLTISARIEANASILVEVPDDPVAYIAAEEPNAPLALERAIGLVLQSKDISTSILETITIEAGALSLTEQYTVNTFGSGKDMLAQVNSYIVLTDLSTGSPYYSYTMEERFADGTYTSSIDGAAEETNSSVTAGMMKSYRQGFASNEIPILEDLETIAAEDLGAAYLLEFSYQEEIAREFTTQLCGVIYEDANLLDDAASDYWTMHARGYLGIDKATGLPTSVGIEYAGVHTIDGTEFLLSYDVSQNLLIGTGDSYKTLTGEPLQAEEPEEKATPLLYHVTGTDGQEMWLFGTIHVGDARMAYLPQDLLDAFTASDALAVEFDADAFYQQIETDPELANRIMECYYYTDGTSTTDHLSDDALYDDAVRLLKALGQYDSYTMILKPSMLSNNLENAYLSLSRSLTSAYGADNLLLSLAREQNKEIRDVESGEFQIRMMTSYSDPLQELLLEESVNTDAYEYAAAVQELYELWCQGDEDALREAINEEAEDLTEEEEALYLEYNTAMSTDRNAGMLLVAVDYLESGDTVFYAVGLAHLLAEDGLVNTLRDAGYTVELVTFE